MKNSEYAAYREQLAMWSAPEAAGQARKAWLTAVQSAKKADDSSALFSLDFGAKLVTINASGEEYVPPVSETEDKDKRIFSKTRFPVGPHIESGVPLGSAPTNKMIGKFRIPCGLVLIVGGGNTGKTPMAHALAGFGNAEYGVVRYGEPLAGYISDETLGALELGRTMYRYGDVVVDSVKDVLAMTAGGAMKAGISRGALPLLSRWGAIAASMGCTLYVPLNPSSPDEEVIKLLAEAAKSNSTTSIFANGANSWQYITRAGEGLMREQGTFGSRYDANGGMLIEGMTSDVKQAAGSDSFGPGVRLDDAEYSSVVRRAVNVLGS